MKPELQLAALFKISPAEAQAYIQAIQKRFKDPPTATSLLIFIQSEKLTNLPSPPDMVRRMTRGRISSGKVKPGYIISLHGKSREGTDIMKMGWME